MKTCSVCKRKVRSYYVLIDDSVVCKKCYRKRKEELKVKMEVTPSYTIVW